MVVDGIPDAGLVELDGEDNAWFVGDVDEAADEIQTFLTGTRAGTSTTRVLSVQELGLQIRVGLHTGEIELVGADVAGIAVHIAARIMALASPGEVLVSASVPPLVLGSGLRFAPRGTHTLKGIPDEWPVFAVVESDDR